MPKSETRAELVTTPMTDGTFMSVVKIMDGDGERYSCELVRPTEAEAKAAATEYAKAWVEANENAPRPKSAPVTEAITL